MTAKAMTAKAVGGVMVRSVTVWGVVVASVIAVSACSTSAPPPPYQAFVERGTLALDAANIQVVDEYRPPMTRPNVEHVAPVAPSQAVRRWVAERLRATGRSGSVQVIIRDASIKETQLPRASGFKSLFTTQQAQQYDGRIEVKIVGQNPGLKFSGYAQVTATRSITVPEDISLAAREETWNTLVRQMIGDLDARMPQGLQDGLGPMFHR